MIKRITQLEAKLSKAKAIEDQAKLDLARTKIKAPADGRITQVPVAMGNRVQLGELIAQMFAFDSLEVEAQIPIPYLAVIKEALSQGAKLKAKATVDNRTLNLDLVRLAGSLDTGQGGVDAFFKLSEHRDFLAKGRILQLQLQMPPIKDIAAVPPEAVYDNDLIYQVNADSRLQAIKVSQVGQTRNQDGHPLILVRAPALKDGMDIIITQLPNARSGLAVTQ